MKKEKVKLFKKHLSNYLVTLVSIFTAMVCAYVSTSLFVFDQFNIHFYYLLVILLVACVLSLLIELFVIINKINIIVQSSVIYAMVAISSFFLTFLNNSSLLSNKMFWLCALPSCFIGLIGMIALLMYLKRKEEKSLNDSLNKFKNSKINKSLKALIGIFLVILIFGISKPVKANNNYDFRDFSFVVSPDIKHGERIWSIDISWLCDEEIKYLEVEMVLEDGHKELVYVDGRENLSKKSFIKMEDYYVYDLEFDINSNANLQGIELTFNYSFITELPSDDELLTSRYLLSTGNTLLNDELKPLSCILIGLFISCSSAISTFIIIQNTKVDLIRLKVKPEDDLDESIIKE